MTEHFKEVVDFVMSDDNSELAKKKAELSYALFSLEREIAICQRTQAQNDALVKALELQEAAEVAHANCDECSGEEIPELCPKCFPLYDAARVVQIGRAHV